MEIYYNSITGCVKIDSTESLPDSMVFGVTWWPTNEYYTEMRADGEKAYMSQSMFDVRSVRIAEDTVTIMGSGRAKIILESNTKAIMIDSANHGCMSYGALEKLDAIFNDYSPI